MRILTNKTPVHFVTVLALHVSLGGTIAADDTPLKTEKDRTSYCIGVDMARNFKRQGIDVDADMILRGFRDSDAGAKLLLTEAELEDIRKVYMADTIRKQALSKRTPGQQNEAKGEAFLAANKTKPGVVTLPSGLQYLVLREGTGKKPSESDTVECRYRGVRLDGAEFFSTAADKPAILKISEAIVPAFKEALPLMPVGSKWKLFAPPQLGFGPRGVGQTIGPNETLIFEMELVGIQ
jgi:FKBP-type peptidyl-prolyl cis-trans isomerase FklB